MPGPVGPMPETGGRCGGRMPRPRFPSFWGRRLPERLFRRFGERKTFLSSIYPHIIISFSFRFFRIAGIAKAMPRTRAARGRCCASSERPVSVGRWRRSVGKVFGRTGRFRCGREGFGYSIRCSWSAAGCAARGRCEGFRPLRVRAPSRPHGSAALRRRRPRAFLSLRRRSLRRTNRASCSRALAAGPDRRATW